MRRDPTIVRALRLERRRLERMRPASLRALYTEACGEVESPPSLQRMVDVLVALERTRLEAEQSTVRIPVSPNLRPGAPDWTAFH